MKYNFSTNFHTLNHWQSCKKKKKKTDKYPQYSDWVYNYVKYGDNARVYVKYGDYEEFYVKYGVIE